MNAVQRLDGSGFFMNNKKLKVQSSPTGKPLGTSVFKVVYRRHTNFSVEPIPQTFNGAPDFGRTVTCTIRRVGLAIVQHYKIEIGGTKLDEQYGDWLNIWYELSHKVGQERGFARMVGDVPELTNIDENDKPQYQLYVPLQFWFNRNNGLALPLIALTAGQKSIHPVISEHCDRENMLWTQWDFCFIDINQCQ